MRKWEVNEEITSRECSILLSKAVLDAVFTSGVFPFHRAIDAGDHAGPAFETAGKFYHHLSLFIQGVKICRTGIDTEPFLAGMADFLIEKNMGFLIVFKSVKRKLFGDLHQASNSPIFQYSNIPLFQNSYIFLNCHQSLNVSILKKCFFNSAILVL